MFNTRKKHIDVHYYFIRERIMVGEVDLQHISTNLQTTYIFTKALGANKLNGNSSQNSGWRSLTCQAWGGVLKKLRIMQAEARTSQLRTTQAEAQIPQLRIILAEADSG